MFLPLAEATPKHAMLFFLNDLEINFISFELTQHNIEGLNLFFSLLGIKYL